MQAGFVIADPHKNLQLEIWRFRDDEIGICMNSKDGYDFGPEVLLNKSQAKTLGEALLNWAEHGVLQSDLIKRKFKL